MTATVHYIPSAAPTAHDQRMLARESRLDDAERQEMYELGLAHGREDALQSHRCARVAPARVAVAARGQRRRRRLSPATRLVAGGCVALAVLAHPQFLLLGGALLVVRRLR